MNINDYISRQLIESKIEEAKKTFQKESKEEIVIDSLCRALGDVPTKELEKFFNTEFKQENIEFKIKKAYNSIHTDRIETLLILKMNFEQNNSSIFRRAINAFGTELQIIVAIEELAELQKELCKDLRESSIDRRETIIEEIGDVEIMLEQMKMIYKIKPEELETTKKKKLDRLNERIESITN